MSLSPLKAISPIDGRYASKTESLVPFFSEEALIKYRVKVEIEYFIALCELPLPQLEGVDKHSFIALREIYSDFTTADAQAIKDIEKVTNHDVKAVEYFIKEKFDGLDLSDHKEFIHFGLTSQDINNTAIPLSLKDAVNQVYVPQLLEVVDHLRQLVDEWANIPLLARLMDNQPLLLVRIEEQLNLLNDIPSAAKFGGATGNFNAHKVA
eukprot:CAMPEP_0181263080 /NCGR_PEP_ID=MMETSP1097-20121128/2388_1 /TAXON_ID=35684 /ORGANISM="Pseudopedinella elastica, Strain CCMP716" /LENGTH=208 /DNA_ID=CAMNT_0023361841 /DNA_START=543 /DNA_END=1166 /DNA_ORIENTATION=-